MSPFLTQRPSKHKVFTNKNVLGRCLPRRILFHWVDTIGVRAPRKKGLPLPAHTQVKTEAWTGVYDSQSREQVRKGPRAWQFFPLEIWAIVKRKCYCFDIHKLGRLGRGQIGALATFQKRGSSMDGTDSQIATMTMRCWAKGNGKDHSRPLWGLTQRTNISNYLPVVKSAAAGVCSMYQWCKIRGVTKNVEIESMYTPEVKERTLQHTDYTLFTGFMGRFSATLGYSKIFFISIYQLIYMRVFPFVIVAR